MGIKQEKNLYCLFYSLFKIIWKGEYFVFEDLVEISKDVEWRKKKN